MEQNITDNSIPQLLESKELTNSQKMNKSRREKPSYQFRKISTKGILEILYLS